MTRNEGDIWIFISIPTNKSSDSETLDLADIQNLGSITMSSELVAILEKNKRESYRILGKFLKNNGRNNLKLRKALEGHSKWEGRIATFTKETYGFLLVSP
jgi:hypothetical protein